MNKILLVDDEFDISEAVATCLRAEGYEVDVCSNGKEALEYLAHQRPELMILDVMMPFVGGLDVLQAMKKQPKVSDIPVVLISAAPVQARQADFGWSVVLKKPFSIDDLLRVVERYIR